MRTSRSVLVLLVAVVLGASLVFPAEDVPETLYDESELPSYESAPLLSMLALEAVSQAPAARSYVPVLALGSRRPGKQRLDDHTRWAYPTSDSISILDQSLRC